MDDDLYEGVLLDNFPGPFNHTNSDYVTKLKAELKKNKFVDTSYLDDSNQEFALVSRLQAQFKAQPSFSEAFESVEKPDKSKNRFGAWAGDDGAIGLDNLESTSIQDQFERTSFVHDTMNGQKIDSGSDALKAVNNLEATESDYEALHKAFLRAHKKEVSTFTKTKKQPKAKSTVDKDQLSNYIQTFTDYKQQMETRTPFRALQNIYKKEELIDPISLASLDYGINSKYIVGSEEDLQRAIGVYTNAANNPSARNKIKLMKESQKVSLPEDYFTYSYDTDDRLPPTDKTVKMITA